MGKFTKFLVLTLVVAVIAFAISAGIGSYLSTGTLSFDSLFSSETLGIFGLIMIAYLIIVLSKWADGKEMFKSSNKNKGGKPKDQFFDSEWLTEKELDRKYDGCFFRELGTHKDGVPLRAQLTNNGIRVNLLHESWHTLIVGTTGSGKTAGYINPTIQILASTQTKPSMVIMDVKSELIRDHYNKLKANGYNVITFNMRNPYASTRWNPLSKPYKDYQRALHITKEVIVHINENPADCGLKIISPVYNNEWYEFDGVAHPNKESLNNELQAKKKSLMDNAFEDLNDIASTLCPISSGNDASWERGARDFVLGMLNAMLEDSVNPELGMTEEKFNFFNLYKICNTKDADPEHQFGTLSRYLEGRNKLSNAVSLAAPIVNNSPTTARGFFGLVSNAVNIFADGGVCFATSADEMDFSGFTDKPTALFLQFPDEKQTRYPIATMCISQLYKQLVDTAAKQPNGKLPRKVYFILDEFANMPKIPKYDSIITVSRGRGITLMMVVQSYPQIAIQYGDAVAEVIKGNCNVHVYLGTGDSKTKEEFSAKCGQTSVESKSTSESKGKSETSKSTTTQKVSRALITPDELGLLKDGEMIVTIFKEKALKSTFTFAYKAPHIYDMSPHQEGYTPSRFLDEEKVFYDIKERNEKVLGNNVNYDI